MNQIRSSIDINAPASLVWAILTDFSSYKSWNPFIRGIRGKPDSGNALSVTLQRKGHVARTSSSTLTHLREPREMRWRRQRLAPGLFVTEHRFRIESLPAGGVRFHQTEQMQGLFAPLLGRVTRQATSAGFNAMNLALKARAEAKEAPDNGMGRRAQAGD